MGHSTFLTCPWMPVRPQRCSSYWINLHTPGHAVLVKEKLNQVNGTGRKKGANISAMARRESPLFLKGHKLHGGSWINSESSHNKPIKLTTSAGWGGNLEQRQSCLSDTGLTHLHKALFNLCSNWHSSNSNLAMVSWGVPANGLISI